MNLSQLFADLLKAFRLAIVAAGISAGVLASALADETTDETDGIVIENAVVKMTKAGRSATLQFKISNFTPADAWLIGVRSDIAKQTRLVFGTPGNDGETIPELLIRPEETLDFSSSHIHAKLIDLVSGLDAGSTISFILVFRGYTVNAVAHVH